MAAVQHATAAYIVAGSLAVAPRMAAGDSRSAPQQAALPLYCKSSSNRS